MKSIVFGRSGQLAHALLQTAPHSIDIAAFGRNDIDITNPEAVSQLLDRVKPAVVFNAAAYTAVDQAEAEPDAAFRLNRDAPATLAAAARRCGARFVHISTDFVFSGNQCTPYQPHDAPGPLNVYGHSKLAGEHAVLEANPDALVVRTAWVYGSHGRNFVKTMLELMKRQETVRVVADQIGTPTHARSLATALWRLAEKKVGGIQHFTDAGVASWYDLAVATLEEGLALGLLSAPVSVIPVSSSAFPRPARRPQFSVLDKDECWQHLDAPATHWRIELRSALGDLARLPDLGL